MGNLAQCRAYAAGCAPQLVLRMKRCQIQLHSAEGHCTAGRRARMGVGSRRSDTLTSQSSGSRALSMARRSRSARSAQQVLTSVATITIIREVAARLQLAILARRLRSN